MRTITGSAARASIRSMGSVATWIAAIAKGEPLPLIKSSAEFVKDFVPPDYLVDGSACRKGFFIP